MIINGGNENNKTNIVLVVKSLATLMFMLVQLQASHLFHKIHSNALPLEDVILGGNENL